MRGLPQHLPRRRTRARVRKPLASDCVDDLEARHPKVVLALKLNQLIDELRLNQTQAAARVGMTQSKISYLRRHKLQNVSLERLMQALVSLGHQVEIVVRPAHDNDHASITVTI